MTKTPKTAEQIKREKMLREIGRIQSMPIPDRWRAAKDFTLKVNPILKAEDTLFMQEIAEIREQQDNAQATSKGGTIRFSLSIPTSMVSAIRAFDPKFMTYDKRSYKTPKASNREARLLMKVFPEYKIPTGA